MSPTCRMAVVERLQRMSSNQVYRQTPVHHYSTARDSSFSHSSRVEPVPPSQTAPTTGAALPASVPAATETKMPLRSVHFRRTNHILLHALS